MRSAALGLLAIAVALSAVQGCGRTPSAPTLPDGFVLVAERAAFTRLLQPLAGLESTPLARVATELAEAMPDCEEIEAVVPDASPSTLPGQLRCASADPRLRALDPLRERHGIAFALPEGSGVRIVGGIDAEADGALHFALEIPDASFPAAVALALPAEESPGSPILSSTETLVHARMRPTSGLDLAALVPSGSQADRLFRLKSAVFSSTVLDGTWEYAAYLPRPGDRLARSALALGVNLRGAAVQAMESFIEDLRRTWGVERRDFAIGAHDGACLPRLNLLPDMAPCYVATDRALILGWNANALEKALDGARGRAPSADGGVVVHIDRFDEANDRLVASVPAASRMASVQYPWRQLVTHGRRDGSVYRVRADLLAGASP